MLRQLPLPRCVPILLTGCLILMALPAFAQDEAPAKPDDDLQAVSTTVDDATGPNDASAETASAAGKTSAEDGTPDGDSGPNLAPAMDLKEVAPMAPPAPAPLPESGAGAEATEGDTAAAPQAADENAPADAGTQEPAPGTGNGAPLVEYVPATTFELLGSEVRPGIATRLAWTPGIQIAGLSQPTPVLVVNGERAGPTLCLTGAIHGDELNGIEIIRRVMYDLDPESLTGRVVGIPIVNLPGFQESSRYLPDRRDLNRYFPGSPDGSLAERIAYSLFHSVINHCDMLVDIHTGSLKRTNLPQLRADMNNPEVANFTKGFDRMAVVHSPGSKGMLRIAATEAGIRAVTLEAGESERIQEHQIKAGVNSITSLMEKQGMISRMFKWGNPEPVYYQSSWIRVDHGGILFSDVDLGDRISKGEVLGYVADPITNAQYPIRAKADGRVIGMAVDQVVMAGFAAYHVGTEAEVPGE